MLKKVSHKKQVHSKSQFIQKAKLAHGNRYIYKLVKYINAQTKVSILCREHGYFKQKPKHHTNGTGCPECGYKRNTN